MKLNSIKLQIFIAFLGLLFSVGCGDVSLSPKGPNSVNSTSVGEFCTEPPQITGQITKVMFVIDMSGSNAMGNFNGPATDPLKKIRGDAVENFLNTHRNNTSIEWGFIVFNDGNAESYIPEQGGVNLFFTKDVTLMDAALSRFKSTTDTNATPYKAALNLLQSAVLADQKKEANNMTIANYELVFLSDGYPTDYGTPIATSSIYTDVDNLVNISNGHVHLSTVYYGPVDPTAENILSNMADHGFGRYQDTNIDPLINIDNLILGGSSKEPYIIKKLAVYNLNAALCDDGSVGPDSDADGLCDKDEKKYNIRFQNNPLMNGKQFSIANRNSFSAHFSDLYYLKYLQGEAIPSCSKDTDDDNDMATDCEEKFLVNASPQGPTVEWTNEMLKHARESDRKNFDSDGDGLLDGLEFLFFKNKSTALNFNNILEKVNGYDNEYLFINHLNPINPTGSLPYNPHITNLMKNESGQNCYSYFQENLPLYEVEELNAQQAGGNLNLTHSKNENIVLVYYIQVPESAPNSKGFLKYSYQKLKVGRDSAASIRLTPALFSIWPKK